MCFREHSSVPVSVYSTSPRMSCLVLSPRCSGKFVSQKAGHVTLNDEAIKQLAKLVADAVQQGKLGSEAFKSNYVFPMEMNLTTLQLINWIFLVDALNFNFWTPDGQPKFTVKHGSSKRVGYLGMVAAVNRAIEEGRPLHDPNYYSNLTLQDLQQVFRSDTPSQMPLFHERVRVLAEISSILKQKYGGCFSKVVEEAKGDALQLVEIVVREFPCFRDEAIYQGQKIALYKRAQILAADLDLLFALKELPGLQNIDQLTMFADYRVPQVLLSFGALNYSPELMDKLKNEHLFANGSTEEVEIRACSIEAVERLTRHCREELTARGWASDKAEAAITSVRVDFFLWEYRVENARRLAAVPYHRTRCIFY